MFPYARWLKVLVQSRTRPALAPFEDSVTSFRVWPGDLDQNRHMNNGRYLAIMDLGRWDLMGRNGLLRVLLRRRWYPVVHSATIRYRRSLDPFWRFDLRTRILAWDESSFFLEQRFERAGELHAVGVIRGVFLGREGKVAPQQVVDEMAPGLASPPLPAWVEAWAKSQDALAAHLAAERAPAQAPAAGPR